MDSNFRIIMQLALLLTAALLAVSAPAYNGQWLLAVIFFGLAIAIRPPWRVLD